MESSTAGSTAMNEVVHNIDTVQPDIDDNNVTRSRRWSIIAICAMATFSDGYDIQALGLAIPRIAAELGVAPAAFAGATSASLLGMALGAMLLSPLADRFNRQRVLSGMLLLISVTTVAMVYANTPISLTVLRLLSGLGLGAVVPIAIAITSTNAPPRRRAALITMVVACTGIGSFTAGLTAPLLDEYWGWRGVFALGAALPLIAGVLAAATGGHRQVASPPIPADLNHPSPAQSEGPGVRALFSTELKWLTILIWTLFCFNLLVNYSLISWLPTLLMEAGWSLGAASRATGLLSIGGITGSLLISVLTDRGRGIPALTAAYLIAAGSMALFAFTAPHPTLWFVLLALVGLSAFGAQLAISAIVVMRYPSQIGSTAIGWSSGFGRTGAFAGPLIVASFMAMAMEPGKILGLLALPMLICAGCAIAVACLPSNKPNS